MFPDDVVDQMARHFLDRYRRELDTDTIPTHPADWAILAARLNVGVFFLVTRPPFTGGYHDRCLFVRSSPDAEIRVHVLAHELTHAALRLLPEYADVPDTEHHRIARRVEILVADATGWRQDIPRAITPRPQRNERRRQAATSDREERR